MRLILQFFKVILFTYFGCAGSSPLCSGFPQQRGGVICSARASHLRGSSRQSTGARREACGLRAWVQQQWCTSQCLFCFAVLCLCCCTGLSLVSGFSVQWLLLWSRGPGSCGPWAQQLQCPGSTAQAQQLWSTTLGALQHMESSLRRDRTCILCLGGCILIHSTTKEVKKIFLSIKNVWEIQAIISQF